MGLLRAARALGRGALRLRGDHLQRQSGRAFDRYQAADDLVDMADSALANGGFGGRFAGAYLRDAAEREAERVYRRYMLLQRKLEGNEEWLNMLDGYY